MTYQQFHTMIDRTSHPIAEKLESRGYTVSIDRESFVEDHVSRVSEEEILRVLAGLKTWRMSWFLPSAGAGEGFGGPVMG